LLGCPLDAEVVLVEMGMNHEGEIKRLCEIAEPDIVLCTLVGKTHIEHFGTVDGIAAAKEEIYKFCPSHALRIFNEDNAWTKAMMERSAAEAREIGGDSNSDGGTVASWSGERSGAQVHLKVVGETIDGLKVAGVIGGLAGDAVSPILGAHHVNNLMAAAAIGLAVGVRPDLIWKGLSRCQSAWGRMQLLKARNGSKILFDGYNASPDSMAALIAGVPKLAELAGAGRVFGVFAEMKELGASASVEHESFGDLLGGVDFSGIWFYGPSCDSVRVGWSLAAELRAAGGAGVAGGAGSASVAGGAGSVGSVSQTRVEGVVSKDSSLSEPGLFRFSQDFNEDFSVEFAALVGHGDLVVVKGSRGMKSERFVRLLAELPAY
jgi:UDP-N-acetylmuramoyl-tripeptide--D-alanyl-D-alanine ligase